MLPHGQLSSPDGLPSAQSGCATGTFKTGDARPRTPLFIRKNPSKKAERFLACLYVYIIPSMGYVFVPFGYIFTPYWYIQKKMSFFRSIPCYLNYNTISFPLVFCTCSPHGVLGARPVSYPRRMEYSAHGQFAPKPLYCEVESKIWWIVACAAWK